MGKWSGDFGEEREEYRGVWQEDEKVLRT